MNAQLEELARTLQQLSRPEKEYLIKSVLQSLQTESDIQNLAEIQTQFPGEWLVVLVPNDENRYAPQRARLLAHSADHSLAWQQASQLPVQENLYVFFNGPIPPKGFGVFFHDTTDTPVVATMSR